MVQPWRTVALLTHIFGMGKKEVTELMARMGYRCSPGCEICATYEQMAKEEGRKMGKDITFVDDMETIDYSKIDVHVICLEETEYCKAEVRMPKTMFDNLIAYVKLLGTVLPEGAAGIAAINRLIERARL